MHRKYCIQSTKAEGIMRLRALAKINLGNINSSYMSENEMFINVKECN